ncbi:class I adenylate-forming enzyme family protein [Sulfobacillus thermosulfidooxidans]|uniref:class I adenylate-forming enzyme family protein n=1 Tax=Sulfobacillus thermosulfidooxidans TaxID=28034 RepID=UPI0006B504C1|nr:class I adenylate-forming enzyme family protein [Sulfobacillus thermosulfidooxidans]
MVADVEKRRQYLMNLIPRWTRRTIAEHFHVYSQMYAQRLFLASPRRQLTYQQTWNEAWTLAKALLALGVKRREHVALLLPNEPQFMTLWIAIDLVGGIVIPLNSMLRQNELEYIMQQADVRILIFQDKIGRVAYDRIIEDLWQTLRHENMPSALEHIVMISSTPDSSPSSTPFIPWARFISEGNQISDDTVKHRWEQSRYPDEVAAIIYTSGSTGRPKGVMLTHDNFLRCAYSTCLSRAFEDGRKIFTPLPLYHVFALEEGVLASSFVGGTLILQPHFQPAQALSLMAQYQVNDVLCVPSMLINLVNHASAQRYDWSHLYALMCAAAPAPVPIWQKAVDLFGLTEICTGYGGTEVTASTTHTEVGDPINVVVSRVGRIKPGGVSGLPEFQGANVQYKVIDPETGQDLPPGSIGELTVRGNIVCRGYYNKPEETMAAFDKDGWFRSGDLGRIDENGYIEFLGRSKDLFKVSGENVAPKEVEEVLSQHPAVKQAYVVGVPDPVTTEIGAAFIELHAETQVTRRELWNWCQNSLARFKVPRYIFFVSPEEWPLTGSGKIQKFILRERALSLIKYDFSSSDNVE